MLIQNLELITALFSSAHLPQTPPGNFLGQEGISSKLFDSDETLFVAYSLTNGCFTQAFVIQNLIFFLFSI